MPWQGERKGQANVVLVLKGPYFSRSPLFLWLNWVTQPAVSNFRSRSESTVLSYALNRMWQELLLVSKYFRFSFWAHGRVVLPCLPGVGCGCVKLGQKRLESIHNEPHFRAATGTVTPAPRLPPVRYVLRWSLHYCRILCDYEKNRSLANLRVTYGRSRELFWLLYATEIWGLFLVTA